MRRLVRRWGAGVVVLTAIGVAGAQEAQRCAVRPGDNDAIVSTLRAMFVAAKADDLTAFHAAATKDFYAYDNGKRFDGDALMDLGKQLHAKGYVYVWSVTEPQVHIGCDEAWVTYVNRGSVKDAAGKTTDMSWLESAVMVRDGGAWRVRFMHSTRVPQ